MTIFSQRHGYRDIKSVIQIESIDDDLRNRLWNMIDLFFLRGNYTESWRPTKENVNQGVFLALWHRYFKKPIDTIPENSGEVYEIVRAHFFGAQWYEVYDFIEFMIPLASSSRNRLVEEINGVLESENAGYRIVEGVVTPITDETELSSINEAFTSSLASRFKGVREHLNTAIGLISDRTAPDYRNAIKESISAVESACKIHSGDKKATLGDSLNLLERQGKLHPALKKAYCALYGYVSDDNGIRHGMLDSSSVSFHEAKFMLVACTAFINYLVGSLEPNA